MVWKNKKTAPNEAIFVIFKEFLNYCEGKNLGVSGSYINTNKNTLVDKKPRKLRSNLKWFTLWFKYQSLIKLDRFMVL